MMPKKLIYPIHLSFVQQKSCKITTKIGIMQVFQQKS